MCFVTKLSSETFIVVYESIDVICRDPSLGPGHAGMVTEQAPASVACSLQEGWGFWIPRVTGDEKWREHLCDDHDGEPRVSLDIWDVQDGLWNAGCCCEGSPFTGVDGSG